MLLHQIGQPRDVTSWQKVIERTRRGVQEDFRRLKDSYESDPNLLGRGVIESQDTQTVWANKDNQTWFKF